MFARPHRISPTCRVADVDHTFTKVGRNLVEPDAPETSPRSATTSNTSVRTGDGFSYSSNANVSVEIPTKNALRMYRVLSYTVDKAGRKVFFDMIDGRIYGRGPGMACRVSTNVVLFETKEAALSERYPFNQVGAAKSGNGVHPRILVTFDAWGSCRKRYGGGPSLIVENAKMMKIVDFLDPPHPVAKRLCDRYVEPFFFTPADRRKPNRETSGSSFKLNRLFDQILSPLSLSPQPKGKSKDKGNNRACKTC